VTHPAAPPWTEVRAQSRKPFQGLGRTLVLSLEEASLA
jgi:hypothetical protein